MVTGKISVVGLILSVLTSAMSSVSVSAQTAATASQTPAEDDFYPLARYTIPEGIVLEVGALEPLPDGTLAVGTRRGDIYRISGAWDPDPAAARFELYASGLHEVLGLAFREGWLYATQRCEVTRMRDTDADGSADEFETYADGWGMSGDYHEYTFGSQFDRSGNIWVVLCLTGSFTSDAPWRGWALRIDEHGQVVPTCSGIRSPGGIGMNARGDMFYTDNQGPWNGTCSLKWLRPGSFQGNPAGNSWYSLVAEGQLPVPQEPISGSRIMIEADRIPELEPSAILFPYQKMGQSASGIACDTTAGQFGPFSDQLFVGDQTHSTVMRCVLEQIEGHYQGACFPFREGLGSGNVALRMTEEGALFVGGTSRGWASRGTQPFALECLTWSGRVPFEILAMRAQPDGFLLTFTQPINPATAADLASWEIHTWTYIYQSPYGSPEVDATTPEITSISVGEDGLSARLTLQGLQRGHVHELKAAGIRSAAGLPLLHDTGYYTLNYIPSAR